MAGRLSSGADWLERIYNNFKLVRFGTCLSVVWGSLPCLIFLEKSGPLDLPLVNREMLILILDQDRSLILTNTISDCEASKFKVTCSMEETQVLIKHSHSKVNYHPTIQLMFSNCKLQIVCLLHYRVSSIWNRESFVF